jgi:KDO2-lipid IV(A) lauroyltransferase
MTRIFKLLSVLPLWLLHGLGWVLGWGAFLGSSVYRSRFLDNAALAKVNAQNMRGAVGEAGKMIAELPRLWLGAPNRVDWHGAHYIDEAISKGRGIVFLTPHLGCFEITAQAYADRYGQYGHPMTVMFRPARQAWLRGLVIASRARPGLETAPTTLAGVKQLIKALKNGGSVGLLPDQVPPDGQGVWVPFFGREAYSITLSARLAMQTGAVVLLAWGQRLPWGRGYAVHVKPLESPLVGEVAQATRTINLAMERLVQEMPSQYLWGYARYKSPRNDA